MLNATIASDAIITQIREQAGVWSADQLADLLAAGRKQRAGDYDRVVKGLAVRYGGDQMGIVREALRAAYPQTYQQLPIDPVNWLRFFARQDSGVYTEAAQRFLVDEEGQPLPVEDVRAHEFAKAIRTMSLDVLMPEAERRCATGARAVAILVGWRRVGAEDEGHAVAHLYWGHDVVTITHPSAPDTPDALLFVALRQASTTEASPLWWCWSRPVVEDDMGAIVSFGAWSHRRVSEDGKIATPSESYDGRLPIAFLRTDAPSGGLWPDPDRDVAVNVDRLNVARSNRQHVVDMQAHATWVYSGITRETKELVGGPGVVLQIGSGETLQAQTAGADHVAIDASATRSLQELGVSRGNSPDAYAVEPSAPQSGVSRMIANAPHEQRIAEMRPIFVDFEERQLLPIVLDVLELFDPDAPSDFGMVDSRCKLATTKPYEADAEKTQRVLDLRTAGLVDDADARVMLGLSPDRAAALAYLEETRTTVQPSVSLPGALAGSPFTSPRETTE